jgi:ketosteroid isomerase-like protein
MTTREITRCDLLRKGAAATAIGTAMLAAPSLARAEVSHGSEQIGEIYELQAAFHRAKTTQDIDLMMSLWADDATFTNNRNGVATTYQGSADIRSFWLGSGSFLNHRFSLVPSFKTTIEVHGDGAFLYFECHDVGNFNDGSFDDGSVIKIVNDSYLAGDLQNLSGNWVFGNMSAGSSFPLSFDTYYAPLP